MSYTFKISIGDWSDDGHGKSKDFFFKSNKKIKLVREAYFAAKEKYPTLCPEDFCSDYEDSTVPDEVVEQAKKLGYEIDPEDFWVDDMANFTAWFIMLGDPELKLTIKPEVKTLAFYGNDEKKRHISFIGYGLFS